MTQKLIITGDLPSLNQVIAASKKHRSHYAKEKKRWTNTVYAEALSQGLKPVAGPVWIRCEHYLKNRRVDPDNKAVGLKYVLDGLQVAKVLPEDNMDWIIGFIHTFHIDKNKPRLEVFLQPEPEGI